MKTSEELKMFRRELIKKYHNQSVNSKQLDNELVQYAEPLDIPYIVSDNTRVEAKDMLSKIKNEEIKGLASALIECLGMHPHITGAFVTGSHINYDVARLNNTITELVNYTAVFLEILEEKPHLIGELCIP